MKAILLNAVLVALLAPLVIAVGFMNGQPLFGFLGGFVVMAAGVYVVCQLDRLTYENHMMRRFYRGSAF